MSLKTNVVMTVVLAALLAFVYFYEFRGGEERQRAVERSLQLFDFSDQDVIRLSIASNDTLVILEKQAATWVIREPVDTPADEEAVERYLRNLKETTLEGEALLDSASVAADPSVLAQFGLGAPRLRVHVGLTPSAGASPDTLRFGGDTPTQRFTYVQRSGANPQVRTVRAWRFDNLDKGLFDLRDRHVLHFDRDQVQELRIHRHDVLGDEQIVMQRSADGWRMSAPWSAPADVAAVNDLLSRLDNARISAFVHETPTPADLNLVGLGSGKAAVHLTLWVGQERAEKHLRLGVPHDHGDVYAVDSSREPVFIVDSTLVRQLTQRPEALRDRQPFRMPGASVVGIDLMVEGESRFRAVRDSTDTWQLPASLQRESKSWRLNDLLADLGNIQVDQFTIDADNLLALNAERFGFAEPQVRLVLQVADGEESADGKRTVTIEFAQHDGVTYARRSDVPSIFEVAASSIDKLKLSLDDVALTVPAGGTARQVQDEADSRDP